MVHFTHTKWYSVDEKLPKDRQRVLYYRPQKLTKVGEMVYFENEKDKFKEINSHWAKELLKPQEE